MKASCTHCEKSATLSFSGNRVAVMRLRISSSCASEASKRHGRAAGMSVVRPVRRSVRVAGVMPTSFSHETRRATSDPSDEGIDDTFVSLRSHAHTWRIGFVKSRTRFLQLRDALELKGRPVPRDTRQTGVKVLCTLRLARIFATWS